jgi:hypothetical protein
MTLIKFDIGELCYILLINSNVVGFEVLAAVVMTSSIHRDTVPCSTAETIRHFGGKYYLHPLGREASQERNQH